MQFVFHFKQHALIPLITGAIITGGGLSALDGKPLSAPNPDPDRRKGSEKGQEKGQSHIS